MTCKHTDWILRIVLKQMLYNVRGSTFIRVTKSHFSTPPMWSQSQVFLYDQAHGNPKSESLMILVKIRPQDCQLPLAFLSQKL